MRLPVRELQAPWESPRVKGVCERGMRATVREPSVRRIDFDSRRRGDELWAEGRSARRRTVARRARKSA